jgi:hypothetical protein
MYLPTLVQKNLVKYVHMYIGHTMIWCIQMNWSIFYLFHSVKKHQLFQNNNQFHPNCFVSIGIGHDAFMNPHDKLLIVIGMLANLKSPFLTS